jgi:hypothetical protein
MCGLMVVLAIPYFMARTMAGKKGYGKVGQKDASFATGFAHMLATNKKKQNGRLD